MFTSPLQFTSPISEEARVNLKDIENRHDCGGGDLVHESTCKRRRCKAGRGECLAARHSSWISTLPPPPPHTRAPCTAAAAPRHILAFHRRRRRPKNITNSELHLPSETVLLYARQALGLHAALSDCNIHPSPTDGPSLFTRRCRLSTLQSLATTQQSD